MKVHITNIYGMGGTAIKAQHAVADIARDILHYNELGIYRYPIDSDSIEMLRTWLDGIMASIGNGDIVIFQFPTWNDIRFDEAFIRHLGVYRGLKKIIFAHDVPPLMFENSLGGLGRYISLFNQADLIIVSSKEMADFLRSKGLTVRKIVIQEMWDLPVSVDQTITPQFQKKINFAANVSSIDRPFVRGWNYDKVELSVTAKREDCGWAKGKNIGFLGWFNHDELLVDALRKNGGFGLLWHDSPWWTEYMKLNASYKLATYLASGIPLIVNNSKAEKNLILRKNIGIAVDSLDDAVDKVEHMTEEQYRQMVSNVDVFGNLIREGFFTKKLLVDAVFKLIHD